MPDLTNAQVALQAAAITFSTIGAWSSAQGGHTILDRSVVFKQWLDQQDEGTANRPSSEDPRP